MKMLVLLVAEYNGRGRELVMKVAAATSRMLMHVGLAGLTIARLIALKAGGTP